MAIYGFAIPIWLAVFGIEVVVLDRLLGIDKHVVAGIGAFFLPIAVFMSRKLCVLTLPELMKRADENAAHRLAEQRKRRNREAA